MAPKKISKTEKRMTMYPKAVGKDQPRLMAIVRRLHAAGLVTIIDEGNCLVTIPVREEV